MRMCRAFAGIVTVLALFVTLQTHQGTKAEAKPETAPSAPVQVPPADQAPPKPVAPKGKPSLTIYTMKGFEDGAWQQAAFDKVAKSWIAAAPPALGKKAVVISELMRDGKLLDAKVSTLSGSEAWDRAAVDAVRKAAPFRALPASWSNSSLEVHWHFAFSK